VAGVFTFSVLLFVSTGIQFWMTNYFITVLAVPRTVVNVGFVAISVTAPTLGTVFGGLLLHRLGGYDSPRVLPALLALSMLGVLPGLLIPFLDNFILVAGLLWNLLFWGGGMVPGLTGLIMSAVPSSLRSFGNSKAEIVKNLLGYFPSPFLYGVMVAATGHPRAGITLILYMGILAPTTLALGWWLDVQQ
jgi:hypothetical protein